MAQLITLTEYRDYKGMKSTDKDEQILGIIIQISELVETYCDRKFKDYVDEDKTEWFDGKTNVVYVSEFPLLSITSVNVSTDGGVTQTLLTEADPDKEGYFVDLEENRIVTQISTQNFMDFYDTPYRSLEIAYKAGYTEIPEDLKLAIFNLVDYYRDQEYTINKNLLGGTIENPIATPPISFPSHIRRVFDLYRRLI
jgi:hypothetical protein